jgi:mRNA interferase RelE/StbE
VAERRRRYEVQLVASARRELLKLPARTRVKVADAIRALATDPRPTGCKKLAGNADYFRIRVGDYRILYEVRDREILVLVIKIGHRRDVYR